LPLTGNYAAIEKFMVMLRKEFVFDNVAVYLQDEHTGNLEVPYARRQRSKMQRQMPPGMSLQARS
jgi:hypothetical protein